MQIICHGLKDEDFTVEFTDHKIYLGFADSNSISVKAAGISRYHAFLLEESDDLFIQDNDSMNGTYLNYKRIHEKAKLSPGDIIKIGLRLIKVDFLPDQRVILDFIPPDQTEEDRLEEAAAGFAAAPGNGQMPSSGDNIGRTMVIANEKEPESSASPKLIFQGGSEIGKYLIIKRIGKGGMGEVYLAKHKTLGTYRALKVLSNNPMDDKSRFLERFLREAKLASEIRHPNVVGVMDVETDSVCGVPYIVMEYIDGGSLRNSLMANKRLSEEQAVVIVESIASALQAAEEHSIVHRDIKPDNIMFTKRGEVKLADLGIAKGGGRNNDLTRTNVMVGTPAYLPPEQAKNAKGVDGRADIYSLGATFYEMLTGQPPYPGENTIEVLHRLFSDPVPDPRKINPDVSPASAAIVMKMLAKDPKDRFQNADELLEMMERTYPPHSVYESAELIRKVIAGECRSSREYTSSIASSHLFLWWFKMPFSRKLAISAFGLFFACCIVSVSFLFLGRRPARLPSDGHDAAEWPFSIAGMPADPGTAPEKTTVAKPETEPEIIIVDQPENTSFETDSGSSSAETTAADAEPIPVETEPVLEKTYELQITTTPDAEIIFTSPDDRTEMYSSDHTGSLKLPGLKTGRYKIRILRDDFLPAAHDFWLKDDMLLVLPLKASADKEKLIVTTGKDVVDPDDDVVSLREALNYAQKHITGATVLFAKDCNIKLNSSLSISNDVTLDGGGNQITLNGPETEPLFSVSKARLTLKNMTLISDYTGNGAGILDISSQLAPLQFEGNWNNGIVRDDTPGLVKLVSVKDGGSAKRLWNLSGVGIALEGTSHLHRLHGSGGTSVKIGTEAILEDTTLAGYASSRKEGDFMVYGTLKNATVSNYADIYVFYGGRGEKLTVKKTGFVENRSGGTINGLKVQYGAVYGYDKYCALTGMVSIGGVAKAPAEAAVVDPIVGRSTDIVFDLTERTPESSFMFYYETSLQKYDVQDSDPPHTIIDNYRPFNEAGKYTVRVREDQPPGDYMLLGNAENFNSPVTLRIGDTVQSLHHDFALWIKDRGYLLSADYQGDVVSKGGHVLKLTVSAR